MNISTISRHSTDHISNNELLIKDDYTCLVSDYYSKIKVYLLSLMIDQSAEVLMVIIPFFRVLLPS